MHPRGGFCSTRAASSRRAPSATGYSTALAENLSTNVDLIPSSDPATGLPYNQATIPMGPIRATTVGRLMEAYLSVNLRNHEISIGKHDEWLGPGEGSAMAWSNNAENLYAFQIDRIEPLHVPLLSRVIGPIRYDFLVGSLKGHTYPKRSMGSCGENKFQADARSRVRLRTYGDLGRQRPRADDASHLFA